MAGVKNDGLTLGEFIDALATMPKDETVKFDFVHFGPASVLCSYRGYYEDVALGYANADTVKLLHHADRYEYPTVEQLLVYLRSRLGAEMHGWKGGTYRISEDCDLWVANPGEAGGTYVTAVERRLYVTLVTAQERG